MLKTYSYAAADRLTENFVVSEFRCKCGKGHSTILDAALPQKVQQLMTVIGAAKAIVTSGYRCSAHDKAVGGTGYGQHTKGLAGDFIFCDKSGQTIDTKLVACRAQDLGFTGIGRISSSAIHLDIRPSGKWYGDETVPGGTSSSVTSDFYRYYGIARPEQQFVRELQSLLNRKGHRLTIDGIAGPQTLKAVKKYIVDRGDSGELTKWVQSRLSSLGYDCGTPDGIAGDKTMSAIHKWQSDNGLGVGYLGGGDWEVLIKS